MWTTNYEDRLVEWADLRSKLSALPLEDALYKVIEWWDKAPITNQHLHINDHDSWPLPWDLLAEDAYCELAKVLGLCYTLLLVEHTAINKMHIVQTDNYTLLQINDGQYTLNDSIGEITADQTELRIKYSIDCENLRNKIQ